MDIKGKIVLITGASSGIGAACAKVFAEAGAKLIICARRKEKLEMIERYLKEEYKAEVFSFQCDIRNYKEVEKNINNLPEEWKNIDVLINNAGLARGLSKIQEGNIRDWEEMLDTNIKGLLYFTRLVAPGMVDRGEGHIINIGSVAGHEVYPGGNVYCGTKHAEKAISKGMIIDLNGTGVRVTSIDPGLVETEFALVRFRGDQQRAESVYKGYQPLESCDVAEAALFAVTRPPHVMIQEIIITPTDQASASIVNKKI